MFVQFELVIVSCAAEVEMNGDVRVMFAALSCVRVSTPETARMTETDNPLVPDCVIVMCWRVTFAVCLMRMSDHERVAADVCREKLRVVRV